MTRGFMNRIVHFKCRGCENEVVITPGRVEGVVCPRCGTELQTFINDSILNVGIVTVCVSCGHDMFYVQKDFNRRVGIGIVGIGIAASLYFFARSQPIFAMASLALTALVDMVVYFFVAEVAVCYACHSIYRGFVRNPDHEPFDLKKLEKYGGRTPRGTP
jgi:Zn ribbon nucleic-acid-binding protein